MDGRRAIREKLPQSSGRTCVWVHEGMVSHRWCIKGYECGRCEFDQMITDYYAAPPAVSELPRKAA